MQDSRTVEMSLRAPYFDLVAGGTKTVEMRLFDEKRRCLSVGDTVLFRSVEDPTRAVRTRIVSLTVYPDFRALAEGYAPEALGFAGKTPEEIARTMGEFYPAKEIRAWGVLAVGVARVREDGTV